MIRQMLVVGNGVTFPPTSTVGFWHTLNSRAIFTLATPPTPLIIASLFAIHSTPNKNRWSIFRTTATLLRSTTVPLYRTTKEFLRLRFHSGNIDKEIFGGRPDIKTGMVQQHFFANGTILGTGIHHSPQFTDPKHVCIDEWPTFRFSYHGDNHIHCRPCPVRLAVPFPTAVDD